MRNTRKLLEINSLWFNRPPWLKDDSSTWPVWTCQKTEIKESDEYIGGLVCSIRAEQTDRSILNIIDLERFSDLDKLIRVMALVIKFIKVCKGTKLTGLLEFHGKKLGNCAALKKNCAALLVHEPDTKN